MSSTRAIRHPFRWTRHLIYGLAAAALLAGLLSPGQAQEKPKKKQRLAEQFLIFGTVFHEKGFLLPEAEIRVRRAAEKKYRWRAYSDRRGEFGIRVPTGEEYELVVELKGFQPQARKIDARAGNREDVVIRLKPVAKEEKK